MIELPTVVSQFRPANPKEMPPITVPKDLPASSVAQAKSLYAEAGYSKEQIDAAFLAAAQK